jgi:flavin-dependent dehydrogenase
MIYSDVVVVGGGPAGAACAWKLKTNGIDCLLLDKQEFPRDKLCAGWITPQVLTDLNIHAHEYPHGLVKFDKFYVHIYRQTLKVNVNQYAIRRYEFDHWLLQRFGIAPQRHTVNKIENDGHYYILDNRYSCKYLVGAGGSNCPVYRTYFTSVNPRISNLSVITMEEEFPYDYQDSNCHLWFLMNRFPGYAWYVPKKNGYLNVGIGAFSEKLKAKNNTIKNQWQLFVQELERLSLVDRYPFKPRGYRYYIRNGIDMVQSNHAYIIGDAAGLATRDMGEGIGPAIKSGILAATAITQGETLSLQSIQKYSFPKYQTVIKLLSGLIRNH